tara:strand:+ start:119 stop:2920 length:2802 start_codon:yes stop_codon:yes gene_type:complete
MDIKKFSNFDKKEEISQKKEVFELKEFDTFIKNYDSTITKTNKTEEFLKLFEGVLGEVNGLVTKDKISNILIEDLKSLNEKFESYKENLNSNTKKSSEEINERIESIILRTNSAIKKYDNDIAEYRKLHYTSNDLNEQKIQNIEEKSEKLKEAVTSILVDFETQLNQLDDTSENIEQKNKLFNKKLIETNLKIDKKILEVQGSSKDTDDAVKILEKNIFKNVSSVEKSITKLVSTNIQEAKNEIALKIKNLKIENHTSETKSKKLIKEQLSNLKKDIKSTNNSLVKQNAKLKLFEDKTKILVDEVKLVFKDKKLTDINKKIKFLEETLKKFDEKTILTEDVLPAQKNSDPLTDQNFVTFDQLKKHYQLFINRVQKQVASLGGGGAVRIDQLDDVNIRNASGIVSIANGQSLVYITDGGVNKFEPRTITAGEAGGHTIIGGFSGVVSNANVAAIVTSSGILKTANVIESSATKDKLFFSNARANAALVANLQIGTFKLDSAQVANGILSNANIGAIVVSSGALKTSNVVEETNLYFTQGRARESISKADGSGAYNDSTGVITIPATSAHITEDTNLFFSNARANAMIASNAIIGGYSLSDGITNPQSNSRVSNIVVSSGVLKSANISDFATTARSSLSKADGAGAYNTGTGVITIPSTSAHISEDTNLFFSNARANAMISSNASIGGYRLNDGITNPQANSRISNIVISSGVLKTANVAELTNLYYTDARFDTRLGTKDTDDLSEGSTNEYYTDARSRGSISTSAGARAYNSGTGVITIPGTSDHVTEGTTNLFFSNTRANGTISANVQHSLVRSMSLAASDEITDLTTGTGKITFRAPFPMTLPATPLPRISVVTAPVGSTIIVDINEDGSTILSTKLTIDASEKTSTTAATPCVVSDASIADDAEITVDIDQVGSSTAGKGLKLTLYYTVTE